MRNLKTIFNTDYPETHLDIAIESIMDGNSGSAFNHCIEQLYQEFRELPALEEPQTLFRFVGLPSKGVGRESILSDISRNRITLSNPKNFNDPMDPILREWLNLQVKNSRNRLERKTFRIMRNALKRLRICSLTGYDSKRYDTECFYLNPLMWAHYAKSHKGICIEYEITPQEVSRYNNQNELLRLIPVSYRSHKIMSDYITIDNALKAKANCWEYEKEARLIYFTKDMSKWIQKEWREETHDQRGGDQKYQDFISLEGFKVKSIYFGYRTSNKDIIEIARLVQAINQDVALYRVKFNADDITKLSEILI